MEFFQILASALSGGTILLFHGMLGGIFTERSGVMNLAIEGYMLLGATIGYKVAAQTRESMGRSACWCLGCGVLGVLHATYLCHAEGRPSGQRIGD